MPVWNHHGEGRPARDDARHGDRAAMSLDDALTDRQPQAAAARLTRPRGVDPMKPVENEGEIGFGNSHAGIFDDNDR